MAQARYICNNPACEGAAYEDGQLIDQESWWTAILTSGRTGATDAVDEYCPSCGDPGEPTGEQEA